MKYKIKLYIGGHLSMGTYRTDTLQNVLSCARKSITLFSECDERVKICVLDNDGNGIMSYVTGNKPKPVYTVVDHVNNERDNMSYGFRNLLIVSLFFFSMVAEGYALIYEEHKIMNKILRILQVALVAGLIYNIVALLYTAYIFG